MDATSDERIDAGGVFGGTVGQRTVGVEPRVPGGVADSLRRALAGLREVQRRLARLGTQQTARMVAHVIEAVLGGEAVRRQPAALCSARAPGLTAELGLLGFDQGADCIARWHAYARRVSPWSLHLIQLAAARHSHTVVTRLGCVWT
jgi:hypothetical protein